MKNPRKPKKHNQPKVSSPVAIGMAMRGSAGAGVHADQRRKADPKTLRKDRSFRDPSNWE